MESGRSRIKISMMSIRRLLLAATIFSNSLFACLFAQDASPRMAVSVETSPAARPPMGWNSYNSFGSAVHEDEVKANADYMAQNLRQYGWAKIVLNFLCAYSNTPRLFHRKPFYI